MQIRHDIIQVTNAAKYCREPYRIKISKDAIRAFINNESLVCHHINGLTRLTGFKKEDLIKMNMYVNRPASELQILSNAEHTTLHNIGNTHMLGKHTSDETKHKLSVVLSGKKRTEDTRQKISEVKKGNKYCVGRYMSPETRRKISESKKGKKMGNWYNNGLVCVRRTSCPEGFVPGRTYRRGNDGEKIPV